MSFAGTIADALPPKPGGGGSVPSQIGDYESRTQGQVDKSSTQMSETLKDAKSRLAEADELEKGLDPSALKPPQFEKYTPPESTNPVQGWGSAAMWVAALSGLFVRTHATTAMNSMAQVLNAYKAKDAEGAKQAFEQYTVANNNMIKAAEFANNAYKTALAQIKDDRAQAEADVRTTAYALHDETMTYVMDHYGLDAAVRYVDAQQTLTEKAKEAQPKIDELQGKVQAQLKFIKAAQGLQAAQATRDPNKIAQAQSVLQEAQTELGAFSSGGGAGGALTDEGVDLAATEFLKTGVMPNLGFGGAGTRLAIINAAAKKVATSGETSAQAIAGQAEFKSESAALRQLSIRAVNSDAQEQAALKAMGLAQSLMDKGAGTDAGPVINRWFQAGKQATGDPDVAAFNTAVDTFTNEYAKIATGSTSATGSTDASRTEAAAMLNKYGSPDQLLSQMDVMRKDMGFKVQSWSQMATGLEESMGADTTTSPAPPPQSAKVPRTNLGVGGWKVDPSWPDPKKWAQTHPGKALGDVAGDVLAVVKDGKWAPPPGY